jgi:hypothetical protein
MMTTDDDLVTVAVVEAVAVVELSNTAKMLAAIKIVFFIPFFFL